MIKTKKEILNEAKRQFSLDYNCDVKDFDSIKNLITENKNIEGSRFFNGESHFLKIICVGGKVIISADKKIIPWVETEIANKNADWLFDFGNLRKIDDKLKEFGYEIDETPHFYLPNELNEEVYPNTTIKWIEKADIEEFRGDDRFEQAFCFDDDAPDILGVVTLDGDKIMGIAGASQDCKTLCQIGIDVLPEYTGRGIGTNLVALLKQELLKRDKVPFYGTSISHIISRSIAIRAGFYPAWAELYSKKIQDK